MEREKQEEELRMLRQQRDLLKKLLDQQKQVKTCYGHFICCALHKNEVWKVDVDGFTIMVLSQCVADRGTGVQAKEPDGA